MSPSMRREWIEIRCRLVHTLECFRLPPCGGSGLKYLANMAVCNVPDVSLHAEGVD